MSQVIINNKSYSGRSIQISGNKIIIDGVDVTPDAKNINIEVNGNIDDLVADCCSTIKFKGTVGKIKTTSGDVMCGNVIGGITTVSGDVDCGSIGGSVDTVSGDIKYKK